MYWWIGHGREGALEALDAKEGRKAAVSCSATVQRFMNLHRR